MARGWRAPGCLGSTCVKMVMASVTVAGTRTLVGPIAEPRGPQGGDKTDKQTTAGVCLRIHSANRRSHRVQRVVVGTTRARSRLLCRRPACHLTVQRCASMGSSDTPRLQPRQRRPGISVVPIRELLHGSARIRLRGYVRRNHVDPAHQAIFLPRSARLRFMPDRRLLPGRRRVRLIHLSVRRQHVEFCSQHSRSSPEHPHGHGIGIVLVAQLLCRR